MADLDKKIKALEDENAALKVQLAESVALASSLEEVTKSLSLENEQLKDVLSKAKIGGKPISLAPKEFEYEGKTYPFSGPSFILAGFGKVTAQEALENPDILRALVELKAGNIN